MEYNFDIDIVLHLGYFQNVDLLSRGLYKINASLYYGQQRTKIGPVGLFAAPSCLDSFVGGQRVSRSNIPACCEVDDFEKTFYSRPLLIRYKNEKHELNEGVSWRLTLNHTKSLLDDIKKPILSPDLLHIQFNLLLANVTDDEETSENPKFNVVSTQTISLQQVGSGFHHYYPITFDSYNFVELDCMIHAAITNIFIIKYSLRNEKSWEIPNSINPNSALKKFEELKSDESANRESFFETSYFFEKSKSRVSTLIKSVSNLSEKTGSSGYSFLNLFPSESPKTSTPKKSLSQNVSSRSNLSVSRKSENLNSQEIEALYHLYSNILLKNYARIFQSSDFIMKEFELWRKETEKFSMEFDNEEASRTDEAENQCVFLTHREEIHDILKSITTFPEFSRMFHKYLLVYNSQLSGRWSQLFISYRSVMKRIRIELQKEYEKEIKIFWRQQMMVHTRNLEGSHRLPDQKDEEMMSLLQVQIDAQKNIDEELANELNIKKKTYEDPKGLIIQSINNTSKSFAHAMPIFNTDIHMFPSKLPYVFMEKYMGEGVKSVLNPNNLETIPTQNISLHLVIFQHGFLGNSFDMRMLSQVLAILAEDYPQSNLMVHCAISNEEASHLSIRDMGEQLASEIIDFCKEKCPIILDPKFDKRQCRVSFVGHSMGCLIIRAALQISSLKRILNKLHLFISLAAPHLGTLFPDSHLVSTGMWALFKWKQHKSLKELMLQDDEKGDIKNSLIYKMSLENSFGYFQQVILVSSPKDQYVPTYSARIQVTPQIEDDPKLGQAILEMAKNLLDSLSGTKLVRLTIVNNTITDVITTKKSLIDLNNMIGRTAHICYLENPVVAQQLMQIVFPFMVSDEDIE